MIFERWSENLNPRQFIEHILSSFGVLWLLVEILYFFGEPKAVSFIKDLWWIFLLIGLIYALFKSKPKKYIEFKIDDRDIVIALKIGDAFSNDGALVVPINNEFDVDLDGNLKKTTKSILKKLVSNYYNNRSDHLQNDINKVLKKSECSKYPIGTTIEIEQDKRKFYLLANSTKGRNNRAGSTKSDLETSLNNLWLYISNESGKDDLITIPVLNTGSGRISMNREDVIKEIIRSFIASCSSSTYCRKLVIILHPRDVVQYKVDVNGLGKFLQAQCEFFMHPSGPTTSVGRAQWS